ncbi:MAG: hypothetical protein RIR31_1269, partial [Bacteroidota bacterium]
MKKLFVVVFAVCYSLAAYAQDIQKQKNDAMKDKVVQFFNAKNADSLYSLAGAGFKKQIS